MEKLCWANVENFDEAEFVIIGIPDESQSHALRKGTSEAPQRIRQISNQRDTYSRDKKISLGRPLSGTEKKVFDYGNIKREETAFIFENTIKNGKIPITLGGDHSITTQIINTISKNVGKVSLVYFDAHPDFVSSTKNYYGSVISDVSDSIETESSLQIGIRTPEHEEIENINKNNLFVITPFDIQKEGIKRIAEKILAKIGNKVYVSLDMDCIDPAFAPGVSVPVPLGLNSVDVTYLLKEISKKGIVGMDIMEVCPRFDIKDRTSHLASRIIAEVIYSYGERQ